MKSFAELFKKYRLRAEFETITSFSNALAEKGYHYEDSIFSHWQKGTRIPTNRHLMLKIIEIFVERHAIQTADEANELLSSTSLGYLTKDEAKQLFSNSIQLTKQGTFEKLNRLIFFFSTVFGIALFFMYAFIDWKNTLLFFIFCTNLFISLYFYLQSERKTILLLFLNLFAFGCSAWSLAGIFYRAASPEMALVATKFLYLTPLITPITFLLFSLFFPNERIRKTLVTTIIGILLIMATITLLKDTVIMSVYTPIEGEKVITFGWAYYYLYVFYYPILFTLGYIFLVKKLLLLRGTEKKQALCLLIGMFLSSFFAMITNLILPTFGIFTYNWWGQVFTFFWIIGIIIAIYRYQLLNLKPFHTFRFK